MMEEANVRVEVNESQHRDITPNQMINQEIVNVSATTEEVIENPEYLIVRRSATVQAVAREEIVIPKQDSTLAQSSESGMDISSQESLMDVASQESLPAMESKSEEPNTSKYTPTDQLGDDLMSSEDVLQNLKNLLSCKNPRKRKEYWRIEKLEDKKRGKLIRECQERLKRLQEMMDEQDVIFERYSNILDCNDYFNNYYVDDSQPESEDEDEESEDDSPCAEEYDDCMPCKRSKAC